MLSVVLNGVLSLGDIRNVEKACDRIVDQALLARRANLSPEEREEVVAFLIGEAWILWQRYDPSRGATFATYAYPQLRMRMLDWWRRKVGRLRPGRAAKDNPGEWGVTDIGALGDDELERALGSRGGDSPFDRVASVDGLVRAGGGSRRGLVDT